MLTVLQTMSWRRFRRREFIHCDCQHNRYDEYLQVERRWRSRHNTTVSLHIWFRQVSRLSKAVASESVNATDVKTMPWQPTESIPMSNNATVRNDQEIDTTDAGFDINAQCNGRTLRWLTCKLLRCWISCTNERLEDQNRNRLLAAALLVVPIPAIHRP